MAENYFLGWSIDLVRNADWISIWAGQGGPEGILFTVCRAELGHIISFVRLQQKKCNPLKNLFKFRILPFGLSNQGLRFFRNNSV